MDGSLLADKDCWEGWWSILAWSLAAVETDSRTHNWLFSLVSASCLGLRPPAAMSDSWFPPVQAVSLADVCNAFLEHNDRAFILRARWRRLLWACVRLLSLWRGQPSAAAPEARWAHAGQAGSLEDFFVRHVVLPIDAKDGAQRVLVKPLQ